MGEDIKLSIQDYKFKYRVSGILVVNKEKNVTSRDVVNSVCHIFNTKKGEFERLEKMVSVSDLLSDISSKHNSKYTDYINSKVNNSFGDGCMVSRDMLFGNLQNLEYLSSYRLNMQDTKVRVKNK